MSTLSLRNSVQPSRRYDAQPRCRGFSVTSASTGRPCDYPDPFSGATLVATSFSRAPSVRLMSARSMASTRICASASSTEVDPPAAEPELVDPPMEESEVDPPVAAQPIVPAQNPALNKKLRIRLKSFDVEPMKEAVQMILDVAKNTDARVSGPVALPTKRRLYCLLRSPHVDKDSREHFEMRIRSRLIDIRDMKSDTIDQLMALDIPAGVDVNIKIL